MSRPKPTFAKDPLKLFQLCFVFLCLALYSSCSILPRFPIPGEKATQGAHLYRGAFHIHTNHSHDSDGSLRSIARAARGRGLDFVIISDHNNLEARKEHEESNFEKPPLFIFGHEISTSDGHLIAVGIKEVIRPPISGQEALQQIHSKGGYGVVAHPLCTKRRWNDWSIKDFDGIEVYNFGCDIYKVNKIAFVLKSLFLPPSLFIRYFVKEPRDALEKWDSLTPRPVPFGAVDAHAKKILGVPIIRYSLSFQAVTMYVFSETLSEKAILKSLFSGKSFVVFESWGRAEGFSFEKKAGRHLVVKVPKEAEIRILLNGSVVQKIKARSLTYNASQPGIYRVEVFRRGRLWIISNAITVN